MEDIYIADINPLGLGAVHPDDYEQLVETFSGDPDSWRHGWLAWTPPLGHYESSTIQDPPGSGIWKKPCWEKTENWELKSNVLTQKQLNKLTKSLDNAFFEIGVL